MHKIFPLQVMAFVHIGCNRNVFVVEDVYKFNFKTENHFYLQKMCLMFSSNFPIIFCISEYMFDRGSLIIKAAENIIYTQSK